MSTSAAAMRGGLTARLNRTRDARWPVEFVMSWLCDHHAKDRGKRQIRTGRRGAIDENLDLRLSAHSHRADPGPDLRKVGGDAGGAFGHRRRGHRLGIRA